MSWGAEWWLLWGVPLAGGIAVALACSLLSVLVVLKQMSFVGEGIAHSAFGGVGAALLAAVLVPALESALARDAIVAVFCVATALGIGWTSRRGKVAEDTSIGIWLVAAMALGLVLIQYRVKLISDLMADGKLLRTHLGYTPMFEQILFGDILFMSEYEVVVAWLLAAIVILAVVAFFKEIVFFVFDEETAQVFGVSTATVYYGFLVVLSLAIVLAMRSLGVILASALVILPGATARLWSHRIGWVVVISAGTGVGGMAAGFGLSVWLGRYSPGPLIVLTMTLGFAGSMVANAVRARLRKAAGSKRQAARL
jgi:zinc transport system permease protein